MLVNNKYPQSINVVSNTLVSNWLVVVPMTLKTDTHASLTINADATILHLCKQQQITSGNKNERRQVNKNPLI